MSELTHRQHTGYFSVMDVGGALKDGETLSCCHCGHTWILQKGSGKVRGFCLECNRHHCGGETCWDCVPLEVRLENIEAGRHPGTPRSAKVAVPIGIELAKG